MAVSIVGVDEPAGSPDKNLHTNQRTISSVAREDQYVQLGQPAYTTFIAYAHTISIATANAHVLQVMADGTNYTRLHRYKITLTDDRPAADSIALMILLRLTTAGTGGSAVTPASHDTDSYSGGVMTLPSSKGTESTHLRYDYLQIPTAFPSHNGVLAEWEQHPHEKPIIFGTGTGAGLAWKISSGIASCTVEIHAEFSVTTYL
jgi:hypothetical protein